MSSLEYLLYSLIDLPTFGLVFWKLMHGNAVRRIIIFKKKMLFPCLNASKISHSSYEIISKELFPLPLIQSVGSGWQFHICIAFASLLTPVTSSVEGPC